MSNVKGGSQTLGTDANSFAALGRYLFHSSDLVPLIVSRDTFLRLCGGKAVTFRDFLLIHTPAQTGRLQPPTRSPETPAMSVGIESI